MNLQQLNDFERLAVMYKTGRISVAFIASYLSLSHRHVRRLLRGSSAKPNRSSPNRLSDEIRAYLIEEKQAHSNFNCQWLSEMASDRFVRPISRSSVWRILKEANVLPRGISVPVVLRHRFEAQATGDIVQMDTTWGYWLDGKPLYLTLLLDDHSRMILAARWTTRETLSHNMSLIRETVENHGVFKVLYTDNAVWFKAIRHNRSIYQTHAKEEYESQIGRACRELGIIHVTHKPYEPQGKGKVERIFRFIQERFVSEIIEDPVPVWLIEKKFKAWIEWYNQKHVNRTTGETAKKRFDPKGFKPLSITQARRMDDIFCIKETRVVDKCNQFSYEGKQYTIAGNQSFSHQRLILHVHPGKKIRVFQTDRFICELPIV